MSPISKAQRCKRKKREGEDSFREGRRRGRERWMSRKGYWRQIQREAGSRTERQTDKKRSTAERGEGEAERQRQYLSRSLQALWLHAFYQSNCHPEGAQQCGVRSLNDGLPSYTSTTQAYHPLQSLMRMESTPTQPRITEEWSLSRGKPTHGTIIY